MSTESTTIIQIAIDTEFVLIEGMPKLISVGAVTTDLQHYFYREIEDIAQDPAMDGDSFVREQVLPHLIQTGGVGIDAYFPEDDLTDFVIPLSELAGDLELWASKIMYSRHGHVKTDYKFEFITWYGSYDHVTLGSMFGGKFHNFPSWFPTLTTETAHLLHDYVLPRDEGLTAHFALTDAIRQAQWVRDLNEGTLVRRGVEVAE